MDAQKISTTAKDEDANTVPNSVLPTGKNAVNAKRRATLLSSAVARQTPILPASDLASRNKYPDSKRSFTKQLQTQEVAKKTSQSDEVTVQVDSVEAKAEETKSTKTHFGKKQPKHVTKVSLDEDQSPDVLYTTVELELPDGSTKKLKGKVDTGAQVNLMNYMTFREIFGHDAERILHESQVKLTGYGGKRFKNHGKFRIDCVRHNDVVGRRVEFFVSDYGSNLFSLKVTRAMKIIKIMCEEETDCKECHGPYDVSEVRDGTEEEREVTPASYQDPAKPKYSLKVRKPIEIRDTSQVLKDASDMFEGVGKLKGYQYQIEIEEKVLPVVSRRYSVPPPMQEPLKKNLDWMVGIGVIKKQEEATPWVSKVSVHTQAQWRHPDMSKSKATQQGSEEATPLCTDNGRYITETTRLQVFLRP